MGKTYRFDNLDEVKWRRVGRNTRASLERAAAGGWDGVTVRGRRYSLQSPQDLERAARAIEKERQRTHVQTKD